MSSTANDSTPLTFIEGIGPAIAASLQAIGLHFVFDLLRAAPEQIRDAAGPQASLDKARGWRAAAVLLQIKDMTNQWAEALVAADIWTLDEFVRRSHSELTSVFAAAKTSGIIPDAPSDAQLYELLLDATVLYHTGLLLGTVRDGRGEPIAGAEARLAGQRATTDVRGRFRIARVPLRGHLRLGLTHPNFAPLMVERPGLTANTNVIAVRIFSLESRPADAPTAARLSEYDGDVLPRLTAGDFTTEARPADQLRQRDLFILHKFYAGGADAQLTSKYLEYQDGKFIIANYRVPVAQLPAEAREQYYLLYRRGAFERIKMTARRLAYFKALRRARRRYQGRPPATTPRERDEAIREYAALIQLNP